MANRKYHPRGVAVDGYWPVGTHPLYNTWTGMLARCYNERNPNYKNYGARGIRVDDAWHAFETFARDMGLKPAGSNYSIERVNNDKGYSKDNCIWGTRSQQCSNRRKFSNNSTGATGVVRIESCSRFLAKFSYENITYQIGRFDKFDEAVAARKAFVKLFKTDPQAAIATLPEETLWATSSTKHRGITAHKDGGFVARATKNGERVYIGYFSDLESAVNARARFIAG